MSNQKANYRILIVMLDSNVQGFVEKTLRPYASEIVCCDNVEESIRGVFNQKPDVVFIGSDMALDGGTTLAHFIRESKRSPNKLTPAPIFKKSLNSVNASMSTRTKFETSSLMT